MFVLSFSSSVCLHQNAVSCFSIFFLQIKFTLKFKMKSDSFNQFLVLMELLLEDIINCSLYEFTCVTSPGVCVLRTRCSLFLQHSDVSTAADVQGSVMDRVLRLWFVKLPNGGQAHRGSGTILGGLICPQRQQVAFWEGQDEGEKNSVSGSKQQL